MRERERERRRAPRCKQGSPKNFKQRTQMLNVDMVVSEGAAAGGWAFLSEKVTGAQKKSKLFSFFLQTLMSFIIFVQMKCTIQKCEKKNCKKRRRRKTNKTGGTHSSQVCVCACVGV